MDIHGNLIGVNTSILTRSGGSNGIGFAIPASLVRQFVSQAFAGQVDSPPLIGIAPLRKVSHHHVFLPSGETEAGTEVGAEAGAEAGTEAGAEASAKTGLNSFTGGLTAPVSYIKRVPNSSSSVALDPGHLLVRVERVGVAVLGDDGRRRRRGAGREQGETAGEEAAPRGAADALAERSCASRWNCT